MFKKLKKLFKGTEYAIRYVATDYTYSYATVGLDKDTAEKIKENFMKNRREAGKNDKLPITTDFDILRQTAVTPLFIRREFSPKSFRTAHVVELIKGEYDELANY